MLRSRKNIIRWLIGAVLAIDLVLVIINWQMATSPQAPRNELTVLTRQDKLLGADVTRGAADPAAASRRGAPGRHLLHAEQLHPVSSGYSALIDDLGDHRAHRAGLQSEGYSFRQHGPDKHGVIQVDINTAVIGDYPSVVRFINGLERSNNFYVLDGLQLAESTAGNVKLNLRLRTYFRTP